MNECITADDETCHKAVIGLHRSQTQTSSRVSVVYSVCFLPLIDAFKALKTTPLS